MGNKVSATLKGVDSFSTPVSMTFKGDTNYKTIVGGFLSISIILMFLVGLIIELIDVFKMEKMETSKNEIYFDLLTSENTYDLQEGEFDIAFATEAYWNLDLDQEKRYIEWTVNQVDYFRNYEEQRIDVTRTPVEVVLCNSSYFRVSFCTEWLLIIVFLYRLSSFQISRF